MNDLYDRTLVWVVTKLKRRAVNSQAQEHFSANYDPTLRMQIISTSVEATARRTVNASQRENGDEAPQLHGLSGPTRATVTLHATYAVYELNEWKHFAGYGRVVYEPSALVTWPLRTFVIARGAFVTPWFTDHIAPLALGVVTIALALWEWCELNFLTTNFSHAALLCT